MLNVVIPTMAGRESSLSRLLHVLEPQTDLIDVTIMRGPSGLGDKINQAYRLFSVGLVAIVDDDDLVSADFGARCSDGSMTASGLAEYIAFPILCT